MRLRVPGTRGTRALRDAHAANFPHLGTLQHLQRIADPVTGKVTIVYVDGDVLPCRINPASAGGLNVAAGQDVVAGEWIVSFAWDAPGLREQDRILVQQGADSVTQFAIPVVIKRILRPNTHDVVTIVYADSVVLTQ